MIYAALAVAGALLLVWAGRRPLLASAQARFWARMVSLVAYAASVVVGLRGQLMGAVILLVLASWLALQTRTPPSAGPAPQSGEMSLQEARSILGVGDSASADEISAAYHRLMMRVHPDHGGAAGLAAQLNAARDRLMK